MQSHSIGSNPHTEFTGKTILTWKLTFLCLLFVIFSSGAKLLRAQAIGGGQIQGTISDPAGSGVAGATVEAAQQDSGLHRTVTSSADGGYNLPDLPVGPYQLKVSGTGFSSYQQSGIVIEVGNNLRIDVKLQVGGVTQTVQVDAAASMVQTEDQSISQVIDRQRTIDLPLNGRQATQLILLTGAATTAPNGDLVGTKNYPSSAALSVAGGQATNINYLMDGTDNNDAFTNVNLPFPFPDALQEFSVQTSGLSAQYGLHPGAVVNIVTRSGTNGFHGSNCGSDLRHNFVTSIVAKSAFGGEPMERALLSGWQIAPIVTVTTGIPFTPLSGTDKSLTGVNNDRPNLVGRPYQHSAGPKIWLNPSAFASDGPGTYGNLRPYSLYGPHYTDLDGAVTEFVPLHEPAQLEARAECFNCLNHTNFMNPGATLSTSTFGVITAANPPRILQLSLKIDL